MSTTLATYLNYMENWADESDDNINLLIQEQTLFAAVGSFDSDDAVDSVFDAIISDAKTVRDETIAADAIQIAADAAAIAAIYSFGLGMAAFAALEGTKMLDEKIISDKSKDLNDKLTSADLDISAKISDQVKAYIVAYKANNNLIVSKAPTGLDVRHCRAILMQFMAAVHKANGTLDADAFRTYADSARVLYKSPQIDAVYAALDTLNRSKKTEDDIKQYMNTIVGLNFHSTTLTIVTNVSVGFMFYKLRIANAQIKSAAEDAGIPTEEVDSSAFGMLDAVGKFVAVVAVIMSVVDAVLDIIDIVDVVEQCKTMCDQLNGPIKQNYKDYFNGIRDASTKYNAAMTPA